ncbi:hypothetical protein Sru01_47700 [Sphaerisporangium rufum]|uniref:Gram-positive cocci surface proteins LPxTG domain-containing protein n=1 Tax=Sphaerisporangium rufum TaxID=1381558 RepID=A0A919R5S2_9ACTN|nr:hypothetical protein [Sphaerisporangium rufum]GII79788.1 hypothetical protein Sru01_47700 [Sphaerisporangium rufum]
MLKSQARRRVAARGAVAGAVGLGVALFAVPALSAPVGPSPVTYTCALGTGGQPALTLNLEMQLNDGGVTPTPNATVPLTWVIGQPTSSPLFNAPVPIPSGAAIVVNGDLLATGRPVNSPSPSATVTLKAAGTATAPSAIPTTTQFQLPAATATVIPRAAGTFVVKPGPFTLQISAATGTTPTLLTCTPAAAANPASATPVPMTIVVASGGSPSVSPTVSPTASPSPSPTRSPKPTRTVWETVTKKPTDQVTRRPSGGAATGGGGDAGPDGRMFIMAGTMAVLAAGAGGLMMRRRPQRG